jgi:hypothetical protein
VIYTCFKPQSGTKLEFGADVSASEPSAIKFFVDFRDRFLGIMPRFAAEKPSFLLSQKRRFIPLCNLFILSCLCGEFFLTHKMGMRPGIS